MPAKGPAIFSLPSRLSTDPHWQRISWAITGVVFLFSFYFLTRSGHKADFLPLAWVAFIAGYITFSLVPSRLHVGSEGIRISWLFTSRFIPYREIDTIQLFSEASAARYTMAGLDLGLRSGEVFCIPVVGPRVPNKSKLIAIREHIAQAHTAAQPAPLAEPES